MLEAQRERDGSIDEESDEAHPHHGARRHRLRVYDTLVALEADEQRHSHQNERVHEGHQHTCALVSVRLGVVGRLALKVERHPGEH